MRAIIRHDFEGVAGLQIETIDALPLGQDDVRIPVHCARGDTIDLVITRGL